MYERIWKKQFPKGNYIKVFNNLVGQNQKCNATFGPQLHVELKITRQSIKQRRKHKPYIDRNTQPHVSKPFRLSLLNVCPPNSFPEHRLSSSNKFNPSRFSQQGSNSTFVALAIQHINLNGLDHITSFQIHFSKVFNHTTLNSSKILLAQGNLSRSNPIVDTILVSNIYSI